MKFPAADGKRIAPQQSPRLAHCRTPLLLEDQENTTYNSRGKGEAAEVTEALHYHYSAGEQGAQDSITYYRYHAHPCMGEQLVSLPPTRSMQDPLARFSIDCDCCPKAEQTEGTAVASPGGSSSGSSGPSGPYDVTFSGNKMGGLRLGPHCSIPQLLHVPSQEIGMYSYSLTCLLSVLYFRCDCRGAICRNRERTRHQPSPEGGRRQDTRRQQSHEPCTKPEAAAATGSCIHRVCR